MKDKKIKVILVVILVLVIVAIILIVSRIYIKFRNGEIMSSEEKQIIVLDKLYREFLSNSIDKADVTITLNDSALRNIVTKQSFSKENINKLIEIEIQSENPSNIYTLYAKIGGKFIELTLIDESGTIEVQKYELYISNGNIEYKTSGKGFICVS